MGQFMDFDAEEPIVESKEIGPTFSLGGETFRTIPDIPGILITEVVLSIGADGYRDIQRCLRVIDLLIVERVWVGATDDDPEAEGHWEDADDLKRWHALLESKTRIVKTPKIAQVFDWLLKAYTERNARPTQPSDR